MSLILFGFTSHLPMLTHVLRFFFFSFFYYGALHQEAVALHVSLVPFWLKALCI